MVLLLILVLAGLLFQPPSRLESPAIEWKEKLTWAEAAARKNDIYGALALYDQVFREASFAEDWEALLAVACGLMKLRRLRGIGLTAETALLQAIAAAKEKRNQRRLRCAAEGLKRLGVATPALSRIPEDWPAENKSNENQQGDSYRTCNCEA